MKDDAHVERFYRGVERHPPLPKHVVCRENEFVVYVDVGECIEPVENEHGLLHQRRDANDGLVNPRRRIDPRQALLVVAEVGIRNHISLVERRMNDARNRRIDRPDLSLFRAECPGLDGKAMLLCASGSCGQQEDQDTTHAGRPQDMRPANTSTLVCRLHNHPSRSGASTT